MRRLFSQATFRLPERYSHLQSQNQVTLKSKRQSITVFLKTTLTRTITQDKQLMMNLIYYKCVLQALQQVVHGADSTADIITGLGGQTQYGRPNFNKIFKETAEGHPK